MRTLLLLLGYNRPAETVRTVRALDAARRHEMQHGALIDPVLRVALDGAREGAGRDEDADRIERVVSAVQSTFPEASIRRQARNRGLPVVLLEALDGAFADPAVERVICVEDDVDLAETALATLLRASMRLATPHVIAAAPLRDGIPPNQCLLVTRGAHEASRPLLLEFISTFDLDGAYGARNHAAILRWLAKKGEQAPTATSQDALRAFAWRSSGVAIHALPMRLVAHRGMRGQHNTPLHALRTGAAFERLDRSRWERLQPRIDAWVARGGGTIETDLDWSERLFSALARSSYRFLRSVQRALGRR